MHPYVRNRRNNEPYDVYIGRPGFWGNPIRLEYDDTKGRMLCLVQYWNWLTQTSEGEAVLARVSELKGKTLGCWCHPKLCHGHILARLANDGVGYGDEGFGYCEDRIRSFRRQLHEDYHVDWKELR